MRIKTKLHTKNWKHRSKWTIKPGRAFEKTIVDICRDVCLSLWTVAEKLRTSLNTISGTPWRMRISPRPYQKFNKNRKTSTWLPPGQVIKKKIRIRNHNSAPSGPSNKGFIYVIYRQISSWIVLGINRQTIFLLWRVCHDQADFCLYFLLLSVRCKYSAVSENIYVSCHHMHEIRSM